MILVVYRVLLFTVIQIEIDNAFAVIQCRARSNIQCKCFYSDSWARCKNRQFTLAKTICPIRLTRVRAFHSGMPEIEVKFNK